MPASCTRPWPVLINPFPAVDLPFQEYVDHLLHPQDPTSLGNGESDLVGPGVGQGHLGVPSCQDPCTFSLLSWQTPCISLGITILANGHRSFSTTPHHHLVCWVPLPLTALESQVGTLQRGFGRGNSKLGSVSSCSRMTPQELVLGCPSTGMGQGSQRSSTAARLAHDGGWGLELTNCNRVTLLLPPSALVPIPPGEDTRVPSQQNHAGLASGYIPNSGTIGKAPGVHRPGW